MGCNIHGVIARQVTLPESSRWSTVEVLAIHTPSGEDHAGVVHSASGLPLVEAAELLRATASIELSEFKKDYPRAFYFDIVDDIAPGCRFVFWFDN